MGVGFFIGVAVHGVLVALTLVSPRRPWWLGVVSFRVAAVYNEVPFVFIALLAVFAVGPALAGDFASPSGAVALVLMLLVIGGLLVIAWRGALARPAVVAALDAGLGAGWAERVGPGLAGRVRSFSPLWRILFFPFAVRPRGVDAVRNVSYGPAGRENLLDVFVRRDRPRGAPVLVFFHGGGFSSGRKGVEARALLFRLAQDGWVTVSANYRLRPGAGFVDHVSDAKRAVAWARVHAHEFGGDASTLVVAGSSAGGLLASLVGLTQNDARFQAGFEGADTSVSAVVTLYGWFDGYYEVGGIGSVAGPLGHSAVGAPPFFVAHGVNDSLAHVEFAEATVDHLRGGSTGPVVFAELPGGQHAFDLFHSLRFAAVVDGVAAFAEWVRAR